MSPQPDLALQNRCRQILENGVLAGAFPGATLCCHREGKPRFELAVGTLDAQKAVQRETLYDLASLTKIVVLAAALRFLRARKIALWMPLREFLPHFDASITLETLMRHGSGLETHLQPLHETDAANWPEILAAAPLRNPPRAFYNCSNYFLLARAMCVVESDSLQSLLKKWVFEPARLEFFFAPPPERTAPTEFGFRGQIHDEAARSFLEQTGDCAGNAGLFADAKNVARFGDLWRESSGFFHADDLRAVASSPLVAGSHFRGLGWQIGARYYLGENQNIERVWSHLGFTGPLLAFDPATETVLALLCNRVFPHRNGPDRLPFFREVGALVFAD